MATSGGAKPKAKAAMVALLNKTKDETGIEISGSTEKGSVWMDEQFEKWVNVIMCGAETHKGFAVGASSGEHAFVTSEA